MDSQSCQVQRVADNSGPRVTDARFTLLACCELGHLRSLLKTIVSDHQKFKETDEMKPSGDTVVMLWLAALVAPPIVFGLWIRVKLMLTEEGSDFLVQREIAKTRGEWQTPYHRREEFGEARGRMARSSFDLTALSGSHGQAVASLLAHALTFGIAYMVYLIVVGAIGYFLVL